MSARAAKLLLLVADSLRIAQNAGAFRKMAGSSDVPIMNGLAQEILTWERGFVEHLRHAAERREGHMKVACRGYDRAEKMKDEEALARLEEMVAGKEMDPVWAGIAERARKAGLIGPGKETK